MKRLRRVGVAAIAACAGVFGVTSTAQADYVAPPERKINIMGEWAHPDDDTSIIGPCGVWHHRYGVKCGIIMVTRGEGGGNATGTEIGPELGLRRENEDRVAHYRSGTIDIFNVDAVDFFYNTSAPLSQFFWGNETLRRITRIIRMTQPDIYIGFTPSLNAGHGNHQMAGRYIWEGVKAAADPNMFPEQLTGPNALSTWQVKKVFSGGSTAGSGGTTTAPDCTNDFIPAATNNDTVAGVWTGYESPYLWPPGNQQGRPAFTPKIWAQVHSEGAAAYPTQSRTMNRGVSNPGCSRFGMTDAFVPFQPNGPKETTKAGLDDAILFGATKPDPGGLPLGTLEYFEFSRFYNTPGTPFEATLNLRSGEGTLAPGTVELTLPSGWTADATTKSVGAVSENETTKVTFTITPAADADVDRNYKIAARYRTGSASGYTDDVVRLVAPVEGRYKRWGKWAEYDNWLTNTAPAAQRIGRSSALAPIVMGETIDFPVVVHNWSDVPQSGSVSLTLPANFSSPETTKSYGTLGPGEETTVTFQVTSHHTSQPAPNAQPSITVTTTNSTHGPGSESVSMSVLPKTTIPQAPATPTLDGVESPGEYPGEALDIGRIWEGGQRCTPDGIDCGTAPGVEPGSPNSTYAKVAWRDDALYFFINVRDEFQSYAVTPEECVAHWLADSVEILIDPRGRASENAMDTAHTFKLGIFPFTNDPDNYNGNGVNGPCWARDADNHQGYSTGPLAATVPNGPNAPGVEVKSTARWVGSNETTVDHSYEGGGYQLEVKIPMSVLPAAIDPERMALNITPYDNDNTAAAGTTTLRHIDNSARLAWSTFGSVQSDPYRWGRARLEGYTPPPDRPTTPGDPILAKPLDSAASPQTIAQSARNGVPVSGREPAPASRGISISGVTVSGDQLRLNYNAAASGTVRAYLYDPDPQDGNKSYIRVWNTSCDPATNPPPDYGLTPCSPADGTTPPWSPNMAGALQASGSAQVGPGAGSLTLSLSAEAVSKLADGASLLVSFVNGEDEAQAFDIPVAATSETGEVGGTVPPTLSLTLGGPATFSPFIPGTAADYFATTTANVISTAGDAALSVADPSSNATGHLVNGSFALANRLQAGVGGSYAPVGGAANPTTIKTWDAPTSNEGVTVGFKQSIDANEPLRTGSYRKTLTFTLSTTNP